MISVVLSGRNDNYGGDFRNRLLLSLRLNLERFERHCIDYEMIFVEWNPLPDISLLSSEIPTKVHCFVVDPLLHKYISENKFIQFYEFFAKNVGASRSKGDYVLFTNAEVIFDDEIFQYLQNPLDSATLYRSPRCDLRRDSYVRLSQEGYTVLKDPAICLGQHEMYQAPHTNASGDFALCSRVLVDQCGGYDEAIRFGSMHQDGRYVLRIHSMSGRCKIIGKVYHIDHERSRSSNHLENPCGPGWRYNYRINYCNGQSWGFRDITHEEDKDGLTYIWLNQDLVEDAKNKVVPYPTIPQYFKC